MIYINKLKAEIEVAATKEMQVGRHQLTKLISYIKMLYQKIPLACNDNFEDAPDTNIKNTRWWYIAACVTSRK